MIWKLKGPSMHMIFNTWKDSFYVCEKSGVQGVCL